MNLNMTRKGRTMTDRASLPRTSPPIEQGGVQPHSQGDHYPAVIAQVERYREDGTLGYTCFDVTAFGHTERYSAEDDAYAAAREVAHRGKW